VLRRPGPAGKERLSPRTVNHIMAPLRMIMRAASEQYGIPNPYVGIKTLKIPRSHVEPFTLEEVRLFLANVREDFRNYYTVRFFTGMRPGEIDGLKWQFMDFERRQILVRETWVKGRVEYTKTEGSQREIDMSNLPSLRASSRSAKSPDITNMSSSTAWGNHSMPRTSPTVSGIRCCAT
jgi:integrase